MGAPLMSTFYVSAYLFDRVGRSDVALYCEASNYDEAWSFAAKRLETKYPRLDADVVNLQLLTDRYDVVSSDWYQMEAANA
jgi:hypothetical protein